LGRVSRGSVETHMRTPVVDSKEAPIVGEHGLLCPPALITVHPRSRSSATDPTCTRLASMVLIELPSQHTNSC
jgi:hypothetical protein